jgi:hypothetical protein
MLADLFESEDPQQSALAATAESQAESEAVRTPAELFRDGVEMATANRAGQWLDELVTDGSLTEQQRDALAAEDGAATLNTLLRRVELGGGDPKQRLVDAVRSRELDDAKQISNVLRARITVAGDLDPVGDTDTDRIPAVDNPQDRTYLAALAATADQRQADLGCQALVETPQWAMWPSSVLAMGHRRGVGATTAEGDVADINQSGPDVTKRAGSPLPASHRWC